MPFVSSSIYKKATQLSLREGLPPHLLKHHQEKEEISQELKYIPIELLFEVYELADEYLEPGFSVRQGR